MSAGPVIVSFFGVDWTLAKGCYLLGGLLIVSAAILFAALVRHTRIKGERMTPGEVSDMMGRMMRNDERPDGLSNFHMSGTRGAKIQITFTIGSLRAATRRGDWFTFWAGPTMFLCWVTGLWLVFMGIAAAFAMPFGLRVMITVFLGLMAAVAVFMPWAAIYTNIEADTDSPTGTERRADDPSIHR